MCRCKAKPLFLQFWKKKQDKKEKKEKKLFCILEKKVKESKGEKKVGKKSHGEKKVIKVFCILEKKIKGNSEKCLWQLIKLIILQRTTLAAMFIINSEEFVKLI